MKNWPMTMTGLAGLAVVGCAASEATAGPDRARAMDPAIDGDWGRFVSIERVSLADQGRVFERTSELPRDSSVAPQVLVALTCAGGPFDSRYMLGAGDGSSATAVVSVEDRSSMGLPPCPDGGWTRIALGALSPAPGPNALPTLVVYRSREVRADDVTDSVDFIR